MAIDEADEKEADEKERAPDPDDPRKPDSPTDLTKPSVFYVLRKTAREFQHDQCTDLAAALTYYAVLSLFPAVLVVVSLLGVFGQGRRTTDAVLDIVSDLAPASAVDTLRPTIQQLVESPSAGFALVVGILMSLWSASGYVGAFGRAMNRIYEVQEGRPVWKLTYKGKVVEYRWVNPHSHIIIKVDPGPGVDPETVGTWDLEGGSTNIMGRQGWNKVTFKAGDAITAIAHPLKDGSKGASLFYVVMPDGKRLYHDIARPKGEAS